ncbi:phosphatidate cytidylyltransferase [Sphingomonas sp. AX6]|uniref:phosphatidate cytidylyltransferase n=1 Tax=Sphingomonas sp. AX6 TaxID=2653171 RepID=UPI0012F4125D|nr:phosphatidate cytidylyltransferase [Sphingomonas sp. AX6]VXD01377.1 Phosphatidate cytidylyltransferase [Sphingomonas sp. AX6]
MTDTPPLPPRDGPKSASDVRLRIFASIGMIAIATAALWFGELAFWVLVSVISLFMMAEWADLHKVDAQQKRLSMFAISVPLAILSPLAAGPGFFALGLIAGAAFFIVIITRRTSLLRGILYVGLPALALILLRDQPNGFVITLWAMGLVWATDIGAFFAGRTIGGPKLAPALSPNKTWAGLIGGVLLATVYSSVMMRWGIPMSFVIATPALAVLAQLGDLYESGLKRRAGVKDSGSILPGHGGVLDRLDGLVPVAPVIAFLIELPNIA